MRVRLRHADCGDNTPINICRKYLSILGYFAVGRQEHGTSVFAIGFHRLEANTRYMAKCRARTKNGAGPLCKNPAKEPGLRCYKHEGLPEAPPRVNAARKPSRSRPPSHPRDRPSRNSSATERQQERVRKASEYCADVVASGWKDAVAESACTYVSGATADQLFRSRRRRRCMSLAQTAADPLTANQDIHKGIGWLTTRALTLFGTGAAVSAFAGELAANVPLPTDAKIIAVARGIQITGVALCVANSTDLTRCQCFIDLALDLVKTQVKKLLIAAEGDWIGLAQFPARP